MNYVVFIFYLLLFSWLLTKINFFKQSGIKAPILIGLFFIKIAAGFAYAFFYKLPDYYANSDTYRFFNYSLQETSVLLSDPLHFIKDIFNSGYNDIGNIFIANNSYWNDLKSNLIIKLLAVCNVFSFKNYYTNIIFFNFLFLFGLVGFYRLLETYFTEKKWLLIGSLFLIPSCVFWCSGIHKDGLIVSIMGMLFWFFAQGLKEKFTPKKITLIAILFILLFSLRNYISLALIIAFFAWFLAKKSHKPLLTFLTVYGVGIILFFSSTQINSSVNFPNYIVVKHQEFKALNGGSAIETKNLEPNFLSFVNYFPQSIKICFFEPNFFELRKKSYLPAFVENIFVIVIIFIALVLRKKTNKKDILLLTILFFILTIILITGYTISFSGAITRYKTIYLPLLFAVLASNVHLTKWQIKKT